jgi:hypothetical protein
MTDFAFIDAPTPGAQRGARGHVDALMWAMNFG